MTQPTAVAQQMAMDGGFLVRPYRIALLNPNTSTRSTERMMVSALAAAPAGVHIEGRTVPQGHAFIADARALKDAEGAVLSYVPVLRAEGFDAIIVAGFGDPGVAALRKSLALPVTGLGEAGIAAAARDGLRYAIVTVTPELHESLVAAAHALAPAPQFAGVHYTRGDMDALMRNPEQLEQALLQACREAITQDAVQSIVIGGGPLAHAAQDIATQLQVRVVDPVAAAVRQACVRAGLVV